MNTVAKIENTGSMVPAMSEQEMIRRAVTYDLLTGDFRRLRSSSWAKSGDVSGRIHHQGGAL